MGACGGRVIDPAQSVFGVFECERARFIREIRRNDLQSKSILLEGPAGFQVIAADVPFGCANKAVIVDQNRAFLFKQNNVGKES